MNKAVVNKNIERLYDAYPLPDQFAAALIRETMTVVGLALVREGSGANIHDLATMRDAVSRYFEVEL